MGILCLVMVEKSSGKTHGKYSDGREGGPIVYKIEDLTKTKKFLK